MEEGETAMEGLQVEAVLRETGSDVLTRQALHEKIQSLTVSIDQAKGGVYDAAEQRHKSHNYSFDNIKGIKEEVESLADRLVAVKAETNEAVEKWKTSKIEQENLKQQLNILTRAVSILTIVNKLDQDLSLFDEQMAQGEIVSAATLIIAMGQSLEQLFDSKGECQINVIKALRESYKVKRMKLRMRLEQQWADCICWPITDSPSTVILKVSSPVEGKRANELVEAQAIMGIATERVAQFSSQFLHQLLIPAISANNTVLTITSNGPQAMLTLTRDTHSTNDIGSLLPEHAYKRLIDAITFIKEHLFGSPAPNTQLANHFIAFGDAIREDLGHAIIETVEVTQSTERADSKTVDLGAEFDNGAFTLPTMMITYNTQLLVESAYQNLQDACFADSTQARQLFETVKDMFVMYLTLAPRQRLDTQDQSNEQEGMLLHNDLKYVAHHLLTMGHQYQMRLADLPNLYLFVDIVPRYWAKAEECFMNQMKKQETLLVNCLDQSQGFGETQNPERYSLVEKAVRQTIERLEHLSRVWRILPLELYRRSMGSLLDVVCDVIMNHVMALEDISEEETKHLVYLLSLILAKANGFLEPIKNNNKVDVNNYSNMIGKYKQLIEVLDISMKEIVDRYTN
eukprot:Ihof_evm2s79 gene=Ihof_evmTU2s79